MSSTPESRRTSWMFALCMMAALAAMPATARAQDPAGTVVTTEDADEDGDMDMGWIGLLGLAGLLGLKKRDNHTHTHTETRRP